MGGYPRSGLHMVLSSVVSGARRWQQLGGCGNRPWHTGWSCRGSRDDAACDGPIAVVSRAKLLLACDRYRSVVEHW